MSPVARKTCLQGCPTRSDTNQAVQPKKMVRGLKLCIEKVEGLYYLCSENKGADLRPCLKSHICKKQVFS